MRITIDIRDGLSVSETLTKLAFWYARNERNPKEFPMTGIWTYADGAIAYKREYRKNDCFVFHKQVKE